MPELVVSQADGVATLLLNRPDKANALDAALVEALHGALDELDAGEVRLMVFRGEGRNFCAGFDFSDFEELNHAQLCWRFVRIEQLLQRIAHAPCSTLALVQGAAYGAGADLLVACTERAAAPDARFRMPGWRFGLALGTRRLARRIGEEAAHALVGTSRTVDAAEALGIGLVRHVCEVAEFDALAAAVSVQARLLAIEAARRLAKIVTPDSRAVDMYSLVESLAEGDIKARIRRFRAAG
jgi:enoyl-CoA hydratase/carnithine racemase